MRFFFYTSKQEVSKISTDLGSIYSSLNLKLDKFDSSINKAVQGFYKLQLGTTKASSIMDKSVFTATSNISKSYQLWEKANDGIGKSMEASKKKTESLKSQIKLLDEEIKKSEEILADVEKQCGKNSEETETYRSKVLDMKLAQAELTKEMQDTAKETTTFAGKLNLLEKEFDKIDKKYEVFDKVGDKFSSMGNKLTMGVTLPIVGAGTAATKFAFDFEKGAAKVSTIADTTKVSMDTLKKGVVDLSNKTGLSTSELNESLYQAISGSVDTAKAVDFLDVAVKAAKGGFSDTATAVDGLTTVLNSYGMEADEANNIANQMLITQNLGKTTFQELASAVGKVTPIAASLGVTTNELFASLASTTAQGLATSESVTALKAAMSNIIKPSKEAADMAELLGIEFSTSAVKSKGWIGFLKELREKLMQASPELKNITNHIIDNNNKMDMLEKTGKKNSKEYKELSKVSKALIKDMQLMAKASDSPIAAFAQMFGSVEGLNSILMLTSENGMSKYNDAIKEMESNTGALDDAYNKMSETTENKFHKALNKAKNSAMELGIKLFPTIEKGINLISDLTDKFSKLSPATQENIIKIGLASAALGPFMKVTGGTIKGIGTLIKLGPKVKTFFGIFTGAKVATTAVEGVGTAATVAAGTATGGGIAGLAASFGPAIAAAGPWILAAAGVTAAGYGIYKVLNQKTIPEVDLFADKVEYTSGNVGAAYGGMAEQVETNTIKISDATKKVLGAYMDLDDKASKALMGLKFNSERITSENSKNIVGTFEQMGTQINTAIDKKFKEQYDIAVRFFNSNSTLTEEEEKKILTKMNEHNEFEKQTVEQGVARIMEIKNKALADKRELSDEEFRIISTIQDNMKRTAVETMTQSEVEQKVIMERLKTEAGNITAQQAASVIKNSATARDKTIADANKKYDETVAWAIRERDEKGTMTAEEAAKVIEGAKKQKEESIKHAKEMHYDVVQHAKDQCEEHLKYIDTETGEAMTTWGKAKQWFKDNPITKYFREQNEKAEGYIREQQNRNTPDPVIYKPRTGKPSNWDGYATGTESATPGLHEIAEDGFEIVTSRQYRWFNGGEKVFNNAESKKLLSALLESKNNAQNIAKEAMAGAKESVIVKPRVNVSDSAIKDRTARQLNWGANSQKEYQKYLAFIDKLNKEEIEKSKDYMKEDYENRVRSIDDRLRILKNENSIELQTEKARIDSQIAYYQKLSRNTKDKKSKTNYANKIAALRQYQKSVLNTTKANQKAQIDSLERSKRALKEYCDDGMKLLESREKDVKKSLKVQENVFNDTINEYNVAIKRLSIDTKDLNENLDNQRAIVILQNQKIEELKNRYEELAKTFGYMAEETIKSKKTLEDAETELISMSNAVEEAQERINKSQIDSINGLVDRVKNALKERYNSELKAQEEHINNELSNLDRWKDESIQRINDVYDTKIKAIDEQMKEENKAEQDAEELKKINSLKSAMEYEHNEFNKAEMKKELNNLLKEREKRLHKEQLEGQKGKLQEEKENELKSINFIYESNKQSLERQLEDYRAFYNKKTKDAVIQAQAEKMIMDSNQKEIVELLHSYEHDYEQAGQSLGERLVEGFKPKIEELKSMLSSVQASFEDARTSALNSMAQSAMLYVPSNNVGSTTNDNRSTITNHNSFVFNSPKALTPSEIRRNTETTLRNLAFNI